MSISLNRIREIVKEELQLRLERLDHEGIKVVVDTASKLLTAIDAFEEDASGPMANAVSESIKQVRSTLEYVMNNPQAYLDHNKKIVITKKTPSHKLQVKEPTL